MKYVMQKDWNFLKEKDPYAVKTKVNPKILPSGLVRPDGTPIESPRKTNLVRPDGTPIETPRYDGTYLHDGSLKADGQRVYNAETQKRLIKRIGGSAGKSSRAQRAQRVIVRQKEDGTMVIRIDSDRCKKAMAKAMTNHMRRKKDCENDMPDWLSL